MDKWEKLNERGIQDVEYEMLCTLADYCEKHELTYFLGYGTLLGAVRHEDFIPWDDDVDVYMPRSDYDRLLQCEEEEEIAENIFICDLKRKNSDYPYMKLCRSDTKLQRTDITRGTAIKNLWIDIFPIDGMPSEQDEILKAYRRVRIWKKALIAVIRIRSEDIKHNRFAKRLCKGIVKFVIKIWKPKNIAKYIDNKARKYNFFESEYVGNLVLGEVEHRCVVRREDCYPVVYKKFRDREFPVYACWDKHLTSVYGDYMTVPPLEEREHHCVFAWKKK